MRNHCHIAGKYRGSNHGDCQEYQDSIKRLLNVKVNVIPNGLETYMSLTSVIH